jgi:hypothetical protein
MPIVVLLGAALAANGGMDPTPDAVGASTDTVTVTATVGSFLDVQDQCTGAIGITVLPGGHADGGCAINFGSTNDATTFLQVGSPAGAFLSPANFADQAAACGALGTVDEAGLKFVSAVAPAAKSAGFTCTATPLGTNNQYTTIPDGYTNICDSGAMVITNSCTLGIGVWEQGSNAAPGAYTGTLNLQVIG